MKKLLFPLYAAVCLLSACKSTQNVARADASGRGVVFTRPQNYTIFFGSHSLNEFIELTHESFSQNAAGQSVISVGIRYRGYTRGISFLRTSPQQINFNARADFYRDIERSGAPVYSTNNQRIVIRLGDTYYFTATCPVNDCRGCQVVLSE
ncbi:MAG: hypothetical protein E7055_18200 [Lentisphaerae bacterium]|nr:hypothetical protein [Lentisphaerota bacterium]